MIFSQRKPLEISFSVTPKDEEQSLPSSAQKPSKTVQFDLKKEPANTASTIAARNILTTTPDPSDDEENKENGTANKIAGNATEMDIDKDDNDNTNNALVSSASGVPVVTQQLASDC